LFGKWEEKLARGDCIYCTRKEFAEFDESDEFDKAEGARGGGERSYAAKKQASKPRRRGRK